MKNVNKLLATTLVGVAIVGTVNTMPVQAAENGYAHLTILPVDYLTGESVGNPIDCGDVKLLEGPRGLFLPVNFRDLDGYSPVGSNTKVLNAKSGGNYAVHLSYGKKSGSSTSNNTTNNYGSWVQDSQGWKYRQSTGAYKTGWLKDNSKWYFLNSNGIMQTGWITDNGTWYYMYSDGSMATGWVKANGAWYYMKEDGSMAVNTTINGYKLDENGAYLEENVKNDKSAFEYLQPLRDLGFFDATNRGEDRQLIYNPYGSPQKGNYDYRKDIFAFEAIANIGDGRGKYWLMLDNTDSYDRELLKKVLSIVCPSISNEVETEIVNAPVYRDATSSEDEVVLSKVISGNKVDFRVNNRSHVLIVNFY